VPAVVEAAVVVEAQPPVDDTAAGRAVRRREDSVADFRERDSLPIVDEELCLGIRQVVVDGQVALFQGSDWLADGFEEPGAHGLPLAVEVIAVRAPDRVE